MRPGAKRGEHLADLGTTDAQLGLGLRLQVLVGQCGPLWQSSARTSTAAGLSWATNWSVRAAVIPPGAGLELSASTAAA